MPARRFLRLLICLLLIVPGISFSAALGQALAPVSNLKAGVAKVDITPTTDIPTVGHPRPTKGARDPLRAGVLILDDGQTRAA
ncbi:MAG: hypothetical protein ACKO5E_12915, partial [bacterium]